jgi:hypothetical protein
MGVPQIGTRQAQEITGLSRSRLKYLAKSGRLGARLVVGRYVFSAAKLAQYMESSRRAGRPKNGRTSR